jgi:hypothetical protein
MNIHREEPHLRPPRRYCIGGSDARIIKRQVDALLADLVSEITGTLQHAAEALPERRA